MSLIKQHLYQLEEEEQELWNSYLEWVGENKELFQQLPKNIKDLLLQGVELTYED
tara:strand:+ start:278 stop:442 length:165 start_codon:yes stop_codon:yes gene_type:complete